MSMQQLMLGVGASKKTYLDDVFSTYLYKGSSSSSQNINNGLDLSGESGMVWIKNRASTYGHQLFDTVRGVNKRLRGDLSNAEDTVSNTVTAFNSNGLTVGTSGEVSDNNTKHASWSFRKAKGFFDVVTWTGNETARTINHNLKSIPGMILVKCTTSSRPWTVWHRGTSDPATKYLVLNETDDEAATGSAGTQNDMWNSSAPNANSFPLGTSWDVNRNNENYVAYLFAGGESTAATARSVEFSGSSQALSVGSSDDFHFTGDWTAEGYFYVDEHSNYQTLFGQAAYSPGSAGGTSLYFGSDGVLLFYAHGGTKITGPVIKTNQWTHVAVARSGSTVTMYVDGENVGSYTESNDFGASDNKFWSVGCAHNGTSNVDFFNGKISNIRVVKGTAVYTSSFRVPTKPLTNITNTKLLCCNNSSTTGSTVTPATITAVGSPTAKTDSPFDDPAGLVFGDSKEGIIKCGSYVGNGSSTGPEIDLGWEPQWIMIKRATGGTENWAILDTMRGWTNGVADTWLRANTNDDEETGADGRADLISTGFKLNSSNAEFNSDGDTYIYMAIRRPDGYVGKPPELGTSVFNIANYDSTAPAFNANFAVDFAMFRRTNSSYDWRTSARLIQTKYLKTNNTDTDSTENDYVFDYNDGWNKQTGYANNEVSWMWARGAGMDVVTYAGVASTYSASGVGSISVPHSLNAVPEMIWVKNRTYEDANGWAVYHKGLNGGTNPEQYRMRLQDTNAEDDNVGAWQDTAPTSTHFTLGTDRMVNQSPNNYLAILFTSVNGISKVGSYVGVSGNGNATINLGFTPRLFICKRVDSAANWYIWDSIRGLGSSGTEKPFFLNSNVAEGSAYNYLDTTSSGVTLYGGIDSAFLGNDPSNHKYIYYAHA